MGTLADRFGRRRLFVIGVGLFTLASLLCGLATNATFLHLARGLQGVGGAAMFATSLALIAQEFQGPERGTAIAAWGATIGGAVAVGPLVGGALTDGFGWEWIFFVNVPIGIGTVVLAETQAGESRDPEAKRLDWAGLITFSLGLFALIFGLLRGNAEGWGSGLIVGVLVAAARPARGVRALRVAPGPRDVRPQPVPQAGVLGRLLRHLRDRRRDVRDVPLHHHLHAERDRDDAARGRRPLPAADPVRVLRAARHPQPGREGPGAGAADDRTDTGRRRDCC